METALTASRFFKEPKPLSIRLWHWITFLFFTASIITVLLGSTLFRTRNNVTMVQELVAQKGGNITTDQARNVAHEYSDKCWMLHKYTGYGLCILLLWRIITEVSLSKEKKLQVRIKNALRFPVKNAEQKHYQWVQYGYLAFYVLFILMALTGLVLAFEEVKWLDPIHEAAEETHNVIQYGLYAYILFHLAGTIRADVTRYNGIISRMIHGRPGHD